MSQPAPSETAAVVEVRLLAPQRVAYRAHKGPYWTIGPIVREVRAHMVRHRRPGPLFIRYLKDPRRQGASLEAEIGFMLHDDHDPGSGFLAATRPAQRVASMFLDGRSASSTRDYAGVFAWIEEKGLVAAGPVTELYPLDVSLASRKVEIQVALRDAPPTRPTGLTADEAKDADRTTAPGGTRPSRSSQDPPATTSPSGQGRAPAPSTGDAEVTSAPSEAPDNDVRTEEVAPPNLAASIDSLIAAEQFDQAAQALLPDGDAIDPALALWIGDVFARFSAAARGAARMYPGQGGAMLRMADAFSRRLEQVSSPPTDRSPAVVSTQSPAQRRIIRKLDLLLGRIALGSVKPAKAADALNEAVRQIDKVLHDARAVQKSVGP